MEPENPLLDQYILKSARCERPKVCFLPTASGDSQDYVQRFYKSFKEWDCVPSHLSLFRGETPLIEDFLLSQNIIYVGGGNTRNLLTLWRDWGVDRILRMAYERGIVLAGISAGSICWFEQGVTDSVPGRLSSLNCLGFLSGSNCPHYDGESNRRPSYHELIHTGKICDGIATEDSVAAHFIDEKIFGYVSSQPNKKAYRVYLENAIVHEDPLPTKYLGMSGS